jgi:hypothetical protein
MSSIFTQAQMERMTPEELRDAAVWLQNDAAYLYRCADLYRADGKNWVATQVQQSAAHSASLARSVIAQPAP